MGMEEPLDWESMFINRETVTWRRKYYDDAMLIGTDLSLSFMTIHNHGLPPPRDWKWHQFSESPGLIGWKCKNIITSVQLLLRIMILSAVSFPLAMLSFQAGVKGTLGRLLGIFENTDRKHRTYVYVLIVTEMLEDWEDSVNIGRKREWFNTQDARRVLQCHKPVQASYFEALQQGSLSSNGTPLVTMIGGEEHSPTYNINQSSRSSIR